MLDATAVHIIAVIFIATTIRSALGFGEALVAVPLLALRIPVTLAAPLAVLVSIVVAAVIIVQDHRKIEVREGAWLVVASLPGIPIGLLLLTHVDQHIVKLILGVLIIAFSTWSLALQSKLHLEAEHLSALLAAGFVSGILGGAYGMNGPPLAVYGSLRRWSPQHFRATLQGYFLPASLMGLIGYCVAGLWSVLLVRYFVLSLPGMLLAIAVGRWINHRLKGDAFLKCVHVALIAIGGVLLMQAVGGAGFEQGR
jgi:uncharacterized membrane protein YfcA